MTLSILIVTVARRADEEIELELGLGFCVDGGHRLPWRFARALVMVGLGHGPVLLRRLPVCDRVDEATSKQVSSTASAFVSSACYLTVAPSKF